jgi:hypothetical protein
MTQTATVTIVLPENGPVTWTVDITGGIQDGGERTVVLEGDFGQHVADVIVDLQDEIRSQERNNPR